MGYDTAHGHRADPLVSGAEKRYTRSCCLDLPSARFWRRSDSAVSQREHETGRGYKVPNGAIYTTVGDLAKFVSFLMGQGPQSVLKPATLERFQGQTMVPADIDLSSGYGVGFQVERRENYTAMGHGGAVAGYTAMLLINKPKGVGVVVFSNGAANPTAIAGRTLDILSK